MGNMYAPPGWEIRHKYKYKDDSDNDKVSSGGQDPAYTYPAGLGPVLMNGCFGTGYKNGDPCWEAKIPLEGCPVRDFHVSFSLRKFPNEVRIPIKVRTPGLGLVGDKYSRLKPDLQDVTTASKVCSEERKTSFSGSMFWKAVLSAAHATALSVIFSCRCTLPVGAPNTPPTGRGNQIDGATYLGVGFDGRGVYSAESRKKSVIQRSCQNLQTYGENEVPDSMTVLGIYDTDVESYTFSSTEEYRKYLAEKSAVTSAKAMFQEEINKASGHGAGGGAFGLGWSAGGGRSSQRGTSRQSSGFSASSSASARLGEKQTQTFMAMLEINIFRYEIFMDDVTPERLNVGFLRDFISLPESYFSPGAEIIFQNFYLRWGTHYIKSAKFGGQLKIIKTKQATQDLSMSEFATKAESDWKMTLSTFSAQASQTKSSSWFHKHESKTESKDSSAHAASGSESQAQRQEEKQASAQEYSNEVLVVQGGDQKIAAAITEMYTTALTRELKDWLESIDDYPKPFSFVLRLVSDLLNIPFDSLFPAGEVDYGCLGSRNLQIEKETSRKYYTRETTEPGNDDKGTKNGSEMVTVTEIRYCNFENRKALEDSMTKRRLALQRAVTVYLEEGRLLSSDFLLPAGEAGCETAMLAFLQENSTGVPTWEDMTGGTEFTVVFDMPYDIPGILRAQDVLTLKFYRHMWFSARKGFVPHLYDGYKNGGSNDVHAKKVSVQGLVMTYDEGTGVFTVTDGDFKASNLDFKNSTQSVKGRDVARAEYKKLLNHLSQKIDTVGDVPCSIQWSNAHRFDPTDGGKCIHFTAASEGDIFVVFASIPQNHETWIYVQITPEGVALYKVSTLSILTCHALRLQTTQLNDDAGGLGSATLYQSYFVCVTEDLDDVKTVVQYGKTPDNEERPHVWLSFSFNEVASLRYYSFGSGESPVKVMGLSMLDKPAKDFICREGTEMINGKDYEIVSPECGELRILRYNSRRHDSTSMIFGRQITAIKAKVKYKFQLRCRTSGSNSPTDCIACKHLKVSYPYREGHTGDFECVAQCPQHMKSDTASKTCSCIKRMEETRPDGVVDCLTECPLTHFDDDSVCKNCDTCKYQHEGRCVEGCRPGQKAVKADHNAFTCHQCQSGHECKLGDEREDICPAGTASNDNRTMCVPCAAGDFSSAPGEASCQKCPAGKYSTGGGSSSCLDCPAGKYSEAVGSTGCKVCPAGQYSSTAASSGCQDCPAGRYSNTAGSTSCHYCPAGQFSSTAGSTSCLSCSAGTTTLHIGQSACRGINKHVIELDVRNVDNAKTEDKISFRIYSSNRWTNWFQIPASFNQGRTTRADITPTFFGNFGRPDKIQLKISGDDWLALDEVSMVVKMGGISFAVKVSTELPGYEIF
ncbi:hypothetical protein Bbelb_054880 [Branchiostoma belcheri]|nr:hypothetical protein Bbelb_054880 [Branchiostoma belcheri]